MGQCTSNPDDDYLQSLQPLFRSLQLRLGEVRKLHVIFLQVDVHRKGSIGLRALMDHLEMGGTVFKDRIFSIFDEDGSGQVDFREFLLSVWNYCTLTRATLDHFAFDLYDMDSDGQLSSDEINGMFRDLYGSDLHHHPSAKGVLTELLNICEQESVDITLFQDFVRKHPSLLFPAFQLQHALRTKILGESFWERASERRIRLSEGRFVSVSKFMELNANKLLDIGIPLAKDARYVIANTGTLHSRHSRAGASPTTVSRVYPSDHLEDTFGSIRTVDLTAEGGHNVQKTAASRRDKVFAKLQPIEGHEPKTLEGSFAHPSHPTATMHSHVDQPRRHTVKPSRTPFSTDKPHRERERRHTFNQAPAPESNIKLTSDIKPHNSFANKAAVLPTQSATSNATTERERRRLTLQ